VILPIVLAVLLTVGAVVFVAFPLVRTPRPLDTNGPGATEELLARRDRVFEELREADFDFRVGKLTEQDYSATRERLENEAARILHAIDVQIAALDEEIEREVHDLRDREHSCPACGAPIAPSARFCVSCGASLQVSIRR